MTNKNLWQTVAHHGREFHGNVRGNVYFLYVVVIPILKIRITIVGVMIAIMMIMIIHEKRWIFM